MCVSVTPCMDTYLGFRANTAFGVNPDVFGKNLALLFETEVLEKLESELAGDQIEIAELQLQMQFAGARTFSVLETTVEVVLRQKS